MIWLKQSTARTIHLGPFLDDTDGKTAETALSIAQADVRLAKNGGDIAQKTDATACTHDELGFYTCPLDATDTGTLGHLKLAVHKAGALPVFMDMMVVPANVWDSLFGTDRLQVDVEEIGTGLLTDVTTPLAVVDGIVDAIKLKTDTIGSLAVTVTSPVAASGTVTLYAGDDYAAAHSRQLTFAVADATHALGLDNVSAVVKLKTTQTTWTAASVTNTAAGYDVVFEPTAAQTAALTIKRQAYELEATLADGDVVTLATGTLEVVKDIPAVTP